MTTLPPGSLLGYYLANKLYTLVSVAAWHEIFVQGRGTGAAAALNGGVITAAPSAIPAR